MCFNLQGKGKLINFASFNLTLRFMALREVVSKTNVLLSMFIPRPFLFTFYLESIGVILRLSQNIWDRLGLNIDTNEERKPIESCLTVNCANVSYLIKNILFINFKVINPN